MNGKHRVSGPHPQGKKAQGRFPGANTCISWVLTGEEDLAPGSDTDSMGKGQGHKRQIRFRVQELFKMRAQVSEHLLWLR